MESNGAAKLNKIVAHLERLEGEPVGVVDIELRVLVACEFSGRVRDAFTRRGHDAMSCDLLPSDTPGKHFQGDVRELLNKEWDLLIVLLIKKILLKKNLFHLLCLKFLKKMARKSWSFNKFPKSLKKVLNQAGYYCDFKVKDFLKEVKKNDQKVLKIDYDFANNLDGFRDFFDEDLEKVVNEKTSEYPKFINWVGSQFFGDNMGTFYNVHENDNYDGKWEILIEISMEKFKEAAAQGIDVLNFVKTADGFNYEVYLIPIGFSLDDPLLGKSSKTITYGELSSKDFKKLGDDFKHSLCSSIAVAGIENIIGKSGSDVWLILGENEPEGYDYESEQHNEVIERATNLFADNLLESFNEDFKLFKRQLNGSLGCDSFWEKFCNLEQTSNIDEFEEGLQKVLEEVT